MKQKKYPFFSPGQVLSSSALNESFGYSDEQIQLTRSEFIGFGIVKGLTYSFREGNLTLSAGVGITSNGTLIHIETPITYKAILKSDNTDFDYDLCQEVAKNVTESLPNTLDKYLIVLTLTLKNKNQTYCSEHSCDIRATDKEITIGLHLRKKSAQSRPAFCYLKPIDAFVNLKQLHGLFVMLNVNVLNLRMRELFKTNLSKISKGLIGVTQILDPLFVEHSTRVSPSSHWFSLFKDTSVLGGELLNIVGKYTPQWHKNINEVPMYYLQHLEDLAISINECLSFYNEFVCRYPLLPMGISHASNELVLGTGSTLAQEDIYRSYFIPASNEELNIEATKLYRLIKRIVLLCKNFYGSNTFSGATKAFWYNPQCSLGERPIPYYYTTDAEFKKYWTAPQLSSKKTIGDYDAITGLEPQARNVQNSFFLQGHYGANVHEVEDMLKKYISENCLPIEVKVAKAYKAKLKGNTGKNHVDFVATLKNTVANYSFRDRIRKKLAKIEKSETGSIPVVRVMSHSDRKMELVSVSTDHLQDIPIYLRQALVKPYRDSQRNEKKCRILIYNPCAKAYRVVNVDKEETLSDSTTAESMSKKQIETLESWNMFCPEIRKTLDAIEQVGVSWGELISAAYCHKAIKMETIDNFMEKFNSIEPWDILCFAAFMADNIALMRTTKKHLYRVPLVAAISSLHSYYKRCYAPQYQYAEGYCGCRKKDTLLLLHYDDRIIFDAMI